MTVRQRLFTTPAPEDAGARTADLFDWQAAIAAADGLTFAAMHLEDEHLPNATQKSLLCEHHEDYAVIDGDRVELVSVKHRELSSGAWTWATLADDGGVAHLFGRWKAFDASVECRMVTNAELANGEPAQLRTACEDLAQGLSATDRADIVRSLSVELVRNADKCDLKKEWRFPEGTAKSQIVPATGLMDEVAKFMAVLKFDTGRPDRHQVGPASPERYAEPLLEQLRLPLAANRAAWAAVLGLFRQRMRGRGKVPLGDLAPLVNSARGITPQQRLSRELRRRIVTAEDVILAVETAAREPGAYDIPDLQLAATRLAAKLTNGGCSPTTVLTAESLADTWRKLRREQLSEVPGISASFMQAELRLRHLASNAAEAAASAANSSTYGAQMWQELGRTDLTQALATLPVSPDPLLALGGICDLASRCQIWFSPVFNVEATQSKLRLAWRFRQEDVGEEAA